jgi:hypothetical protein
MDTPAGIGVKENNKNYSKILYFPYTLQVLPSAAKSGPSLHGLRGVA